MSPNFDVTDNVEKASEEPRKNLKLEKVEL
jgi:hypothetical protein